MDPFFEYLNDLEGHIGKGDLKNMVRGIQALESQPIPKCTREEILNEDHPSKLFDVLQAHDLLSKSNPNTLIVLLGYAKLLRLAKHVEVRFEKGFDRHYSFEEVEREADTRHSQPTGQEGNQQIQEHHAAVVPSATQRIAEGKPQYPDQQPSTSSAAGPNTSISTVPLNNQPTTLPKNTQNRSVPVPHEPQVSAIGPCGRVTMEQEVGALFLYNEWNKDMYGLTGFHRTFVREFCARKEIVKESVKAYSTVLSLKITDDQKKDAEKCGVTLIPAQLWEYCDQDAVPKLKWLRYYSVHYPSLKCLLNIRFVVGYAPKTGFEAAAIRKELFPGAQLVLINHICPEDKYLLGNTSKNQTLENKMLEIASEADMLFSIGPKIHEYFQNKYKARVKGKLLLEIPHIEILPKPENMLFCNNQPLRRSEASLQILTYGELNTEVLTKCEDFGKSIGKTANAWKEKPKPDWKIHGVSTDVKKEEMYMRIRQMESCCVQPNVDLYPYFSITALVKSLLQSDFCMPLPYYRDYSFQGIEAMAVGLPTMTEENSHLACFIKKYFEDHAKDCVVHEPEANLHRKLLENLEYPFVALDRAKELKIKMHENEFMFIGDAMFAALLTYKQSQVGQEHSSVPGMEKVKTNTKSQSDKKGKKDISEEKKLDVGICTTKPKKFNIKTNEKHSCKSTQFERQPQRPTGFNKKRLPQPCRQSGAKEAVDHKTTGAQPMIIERKESQILRENSTQIKQYHTASWKRQKSTKGERIKQEQPEKHRTMRETSMTRIGVTHCVNPEKSKSKQAVSMGTVKTPASLKTKAAQSEMKVKDKPAAIQKPQFKPSQEQAGKVERFQTRKRITRTTKSVSNEAEAKHHVSRNVKEEVTKRSIIVDEISMTQHSITASNSNKCKGTKGVKVEVVATSDPQKTTIYLKGKGHDVTKTTQRSHSTQAEIIREGENPRRQSVNSEQPNKSQQQEVEKEKKQFKSSKRSTPVEVRALSKTMDDVSMTQHEVVKTETVSNHGKCGKSQTETFVTGGSTGTGNLRVKEETKLSGGNNPEEVTTSGEEGGQGSSLLRATIELHLVPSKDRLQPEEGDICIEVLSSEEGAAALIDFRKQLKQTVEFLLFVKGAHQEIQNILIKIIGDVELCKITVHSLGLLLKLPALYNLYRLKQVCRSGSLAKAFEPLLITDEMTNTAKKSGVVLQLTATYDEETFKELELFFLKRDGGGIRQIPLNTYFEEENIADIQFESDDEDYAIKTPEKVSASKDQASQTNNNITEGKPLQLLLLQIDSQHEIQESAEQYVPVIFNSSTYTGWKGQTCYFIQISMNLTGQVQHILSCRPEILALLGVQRYLVRDTDYADLSKTDLEEQITESGRPILSRIDVTSSVSTQATSLLLCVASPKQHKEYDIRHYLDLAQTDLPSLATRVSKLRKMLVTSLNKNSKFERESLETKKILEKKIDTLQTEKGILENQLAEAKQQILVLENQNSKSTLDRQSAESVAAQQLTDILSLKNGIRALEDRIKDKNKIIDDFKYKLSKLHVSDVKQDAELQKKIAEILGEDYPSKDPKKGDSTGIKSVEEDMEKHGPAMEQTADEVLFLYTEWNKNMCGLTGFHRRLIQEFCARKAKVGQIVKAYSTVLSLKLTDDQMTDAASCGVTLIPGTFSDPEDEVPELKWLRYYEIHFPDILKLENIQYVVGYAPKTGAAAAIIRKRLFPGAKLFLINHICPGEKSLLGNENEEQKLAETMLELASEADFLFSIGPKIYQHFKNQYRVKFNDKQLSDIPHEEILPKPECVFFDINQTIIPDDYGFNILTYGEDDTPEALNKCHIMAQSIGKAANIRKEDRCFAPDWKIQGIAPNVKQEDISELVEMMASSHVRPRFYPDCSVGALLTTLQQSHLCLPSPYYKDYGLQGLEAMAAGLPTMIEDDSQLAWLLKKHFKDHAGDCIIHDPLGKLCDDKILGTMSNPVVAFEKANELKIALQAHEDIFLGSAKLTSLLTDRALQQTRMNSRVHGVGEKQKTTSTIKATQGSDELKVIIGVNQEPFMQQGEKESETALTECQKELKQKVEEVLADEGGCHKIVDTVKENLGDVYPYDLTAD